MPSLSIPTPQRDAFVEITRELQAVVDDAGLSAGTLTAFVPHTTAGITINENADPDVVHDMLLQLDEMVPWRQPFYRHAEGNSASHVKASMMGSSVVVLVEGGRLRLGTWQGVYLCEFDGPRTRSVWVRLDG
ncbi:MAG: secondary thiamine-phosphate synthase enzyme YjbQ [Planctomycetota bacterium]